jgi:hypothetical protein
MCRTPVNSALTVTDKVVISVDGACSGRRCVCAACATRNGRVIGEGNRSLPEVDGYILAAEIAALALGVELVADGPEPSRPRMLWADCVAGREIALLDENLSRLVNEMIQPFQRDLHEVALRILGPGSERPS